MADRPSAVVSDSSRPRSGPSPTIMKRHGDVLGYSRDNPEKCSKVFDWIEPGYRPDDQHVFANAEHPGAPLHACLRRAPNPRRLPL
jgi:hypothetical protein